MAPVAFHRSALRLTSFLALGLVHGCGAATPRSASADGVVTCDPADLTPCELAITNALLSGISPKAQVEAYLAAREDADGADPWVSAYASLTSSDTALKLIADAESREGLAKALPKAAVVSIDAMPPPKSISIDELWLALGEAAGADHLVVASESKIRHVFPRDPLAPFAAGLPAIISGSPTGIQNQVAVARHLRVAVESASAFDYVAAARAADALSGALESATPETESERRGSAALTKLRSAGLVLPKDSTDEDEEDDSSASADAPPVPAKPTETPYGDLLRVQIADDQEATWKIRRERVLSALPAERRAAMTALYERPDTCRSPAPPKIVERSDLLFAYQIPGGLKPAVRPMMDDPADARLPLAEWYERYRSFVDVVVKEKAAWAFVTTMLLERGDASGLPPTGTPLYRQVSDLAQRHLGAIAKLSEAYPDRFDALPLAQLTAASGSLGDPPLREALIDLTRSAVRNQIQRAEDAEGLARALVAGIVAGMSYPPAVSAAHYAALQGAFVGKLRGDLKDQAGWGIAGLHSADLLFRILTQETPPDFAPTTQRIASALSTKDIEQPGLAALAISAVRYAQLGAEGQLSAQVFRDGRSNEVRPDRAAARNALKDAIASLGDAPPPSESLLNDVTDLTDGFVASSVVAVAETEANAPTACAADAKWKPPLKAERAFAKLRDMRRGILANPAYQKGDHLWIRRTRLLVTIISDALDLLEAQRSSLPPTYAVTRDSASGAIKEALRELNEPEIVGAIAAAYILGRDFTAAKSGDEFFANMVPAFRELLGGIAHFVAPDADSGSQFELLRAMLDAAKSEGDTKTRDFGAMLLTYAEVLLKSDKSDQGELLLLGSLMLDAALGQAPTDKALSLADDQKGSVAWAMHFLSAFPRIRKGESPNTASFASLMNEARRDHCGVASVPQIVEVIDATGNFAAGRRNEARKQLDAVLATAESDGLSIPRAAFMYREETKTNIFNLSLEVSYGSGLLVGSNSFQIGLGMRTPGEPTSSFTTSETSGNRQQTAEETARYYIHAAALTALYHFVEGDDARGIAAARRSIEAVIQGVRLGNEAIGASANIALADDATGTLAVVAQLAAERGHPFLAGDLWTIVKNSLGISVTDDEVNALLDTPPLGFGQYEASEAVIARTKRTLTMLTQQLACTQNDLPTDGFQNASCQQYPLGLSLRVADALENLPHLQRGAEKGSSQCATMRTIDTFLSGLERGAYDPDAFTAAVRALRAESRTYDAAVLFTRQRAPAHCSPEILATARELGRSDALGPAMRADLLSAGLNCSLGKLDGEVKKDLTSLESTTRSLADQTRALRLLLFTTALSLQEKRPDLLTTVTSAPGFVDHWMSVGSVPATLALTLAHAAPLLGDVPPDTSLMDSSYRLLCESFPSEDRRSMCSTLSQMRDTKRSLGERKQAATKALEEVVKMAEAP